MSQLRAIDNYYTYIPTKKTVMRLTNLLRSDAGTCRYCGNKARVLTLDHPGCRRTHLHGWNQMVQLTSEAVRAHNFDEKNLRPSLAEIARNSYGDDATINEAL